MAGELVPSLSKQGLRALDPNLPLLATEAAVDIENILFNREKNYTAIQHLGDQLNNSIKPSSSNGPLSSLMDSATLTVLGEAMAETFRKETLEKIEDLLNSTAKIAKLLTSDKTESKDLIQARNFCIALSRATIAYHKSIIDLGPSHPFRR